VYVHEPVCAAEVLSLLAVGPGRVVVDATLGEGGHAERILEASAPDGRLVGCDRDAEILAVAGERLARFGERVRCVHADVGTEGALAAAVGDDPDWRPHGVLLDLGISSWHYAQPERGFSFDHDGPLDMRLDRSGGAPTCAERLAHVGQGDLHRLLRDLGDVRGAGRIAGAILRARDAGALRSTADLARVVAGAAPRPPRGRRRLHPATRTFMALRIWVNGELDRIPVALADARALVRPGGRIVVIAFHSGEDRLVKRTFREWHRAGTARQILVKPLVPSADEQGRNPRARSAKVRAVECVGATTP
jgi:16S rRNA (cytosine1402-N4)-methyltransferase